MSKNVDRCVDLTLRRAQGEVIWLKRLALTLSVSKWEGEHIRFPAACQDGRSESRPMKCFNGTKLHRPSVRVFGLVLGVVAAVSPSPAVTQNSKDDDRAVLARLAGESLLLDAVAVGTQVVAVGERGHILTIAAGRWEQKPAPTSQMLTAVAAADGHLWAVGHDAVILHSADQGQTWERQYSAPELGPLFDVWFENPSHGIAVGTFSLFLETRDGGQTWEQRTIASFVPEETDAAPNDTAGSAPDADREEEYVDLEALGRDPGPVAQPHFYAIARAVDGALYIAGENGTLARSDDLAQSWTVLASPYRGSFFHILPLSDGAVLAFGLRGRLFRSEDRGATWQELPTQTLASLMGGTETRAGEVVLVGLAGTVLDSRDGGRSFAARNIAERLGLADAAETPDGQILLVGEKGYLWFAEPPPQFENDRP
jgi:photosystem II stability/assembly factor-like uncharacterized protein